MWRNRVLYTAQIVGSILGALVLAALLATLSKTANGFWPFLNEACAKVVSAFHGDFGLSAATGVPAMVRIFAVLPSTLRLLGAGALVALVIGIPLGALLSATRFLREIAPLMGIPAAIPAFAGALGLIWIAVRVLHWPEPLQASAISGSVIIASGGWDVALRAFFLPVLTVGVAGAASIQATFRRAATSAWSAPYRNGLRMMGLGTVDIDLRYAVPTVAAALLRNLGEVALVLISATAVAEWVFHLDGAGALFIKAVAMGDWNVAAAVLFIFAVIKLAMDFLGLAASWTMGPGEDAA